MSIEYICRQLRSLETSIWRIKFCVLLSNIIVHTVLGLSFFLFVFGYHLDTIKFALLKYTVWWFLV